MNLIGLILDMPGLFALRLFPGPVFSDLLGAPLATGLARLGRLAVAFGTQGLLFGLPSPFLQSEVLGGLTGMIETGHSPGFGFSTTV